MTKNFQHLNQAPSFKALHSCSVPTLSDCLSTARLNSDMITHRHLRYLYGTTPVSDEILTLFQSLSEEQNLIEKYQRLLAGDKVNYSENRSVNHHHSRGNDHPFYMEERERIFSFSEDIKRGAIVNSEGTPFNTIVQVGIGGSVLGPEAIFNALRNSISSSFPVHFISNIDPDETHAILNKIPIKTTLFIIVSKSGATQETSENMKLIRNILEKNGIDKAKINEHCVAITTKESKLDSEAVSPNRFYIDEAIGGRYSSTSAVGILLLSLCFGKDVVSSFLKGAHEMDIESKEADIRKNACLLAALIGVWERSILGYQAKAIIPYNSSLSRFVAHLQQVDCESNGKRVCVKRKELNYETAPIVFGEPGTNAQHAFFQMLHQGTTITPVQFIGVKKSHQEDPLSQEVQTLLNHNLVAQMIAFAQGKEDPDPNKCFPGNRPSTLVLLDAITPESIGALLAFYENVIMFQGFLWNINSFDQEGVQLGKTLASSLGGDTSESDSNSKSGSDLLFALSELVLE